MTINSLQAALGYARLGWRVLPILADSKAPATEHGVHDATTDEAQLRAWHAKSGGELVFAFVGETDLHKPHYYRIASSYFTIEYDSTNSDASHVHCVWSDPTTNFGGDALRAHLKAEHDASDTPR